MCKLLLTDGWEYSPKSRQFHHYARVNIVLTMCVPQAKLISAEVLDLFFNEIVNCSTGAVV